MFPRVSLVFVALLGCASAPFQPTPTSDVFTKQSFPYNLIGDAEKILEKITSRAPFDLNCPADEMTYKSIGQDTVGASGCGRRATYKWVNEVGWVMNAASADAPADAAPADAAPTDAAPTDAAPTDAAPTDAAPTDTELPPE